MINTIRTILGSWLSGDGFMPHGHYYFWQPDILWLHTLSDAISGASYFVIPFAIFMLMEKRQDVWKAKPVFWLFIAFILSCGVTHFMEVYATWQPAYRISGWLKAINAVISLATAIAIWPLIPKLLNTPSTSSLKKANNELQKQIKERERAEQELQLHKDNLEVLVKNRTKDLENTLLQLKCEARDRQRAQEQANFQASMLNQLDSSIIAADANRRIVYWNQYAEHLFGWKKEEALGKKTTELLLPKSGKLINEAHHQDFIQNKHWEGEMTMRHRDGKTFPVHVSAATLANERGESVGYSLVCFDMTDHVRIASRLRRDKEKAERAALAKQDFLSTMSHEIRTPLNVVVNMTRLLMDESPREDQLEYMKSLQFSANHLLVIINDILDFAKIEAGKIKLEKINFSPREVTEGIIKAFKFRAEEKNISIRSDWDDAIPEYVLGDEVRLTQILNNLVGNAIKFTERGFVSVHTELLSKKKDKCKIKFDIRDTGIGIPADRIKSIFQDYTQGADDTTRKFGGTGLGLTICKRLVAIQKGELSVRSKEGFGSSFSFILTYEHNAKITKESQQARQKIDIEKLKGINLLLVEDNPSNRMVATSFLQKVGIQVTTAEHGKQALEKVQQTTFDIILMDLQMPIMSGCDAASAIRNLGGDYENLPIIALTADVVQGVKDRVKECGMSDYLSKPFNPDELHYKIALNMGLISSKEVPFVPNEEEDDMVQLHRLIDQYNDDVKFVTNLLDSLRRSFQLLTEQVANSASQKDVYELRRLTHKLLPSIKMVGNQELHTHLTGLKEALDQDSVDEIEVNQFVDEIRKSTTESIEYIDGLVTTMQDHKNHLTSQE
ncbi:response regulator [Tunicatimonas pelagia]|uniref:response regulator n=1 Tax=Tunicatimonas pelagia TaxID=931531 RepID=UPI002666B198|nr:response regulator [Tunicatimonas pelagia]WKN41224.1 response regulator [Tunicatimonas pelagia]